MQDLDGFCYKSIGICKYLNPFYSLRVHNLILWRSHGEKSDTQIWLLVSARLLLIKKKQIKFTSAQPPTIADVFVNYCGQRQYLQTEAKRQSSRKDAAERTASELLLW